MRFKVLSAIRYGGKHRAEGTYVEMDEAEAAKIGAQYLDIAGAQAEAAEKAKAEAEAKAKAEAEAAGKAKAEAAEKPTAKTGGKK